MHGKPLSVRHTVRTVMPRLARSAGVLARPVQAQCLGMMTFTELPSIPSDHVVPFTDHDGKGSPE